MRGTLHLFTYRNIPVKVHWSFMLIVGWFAYVAWSERLTSGETLWLIVLVLAMFSFVVLHEFGHALAAKRYGVDTRDIVLLPIGGMARLERIPVNPKEELVIAVAGPLVNVALAAILGIGILLFGIWGLHGEVADLNGMLHFKGVVVLLFVMNIGLFVFNLLPAFPMDGGRVFRALLTMWVGRDAATKWASRIGQILAIVFFIYGSGIGHYGLMMIGVFIFFAAKSESELSRHPRSLASEQPGFSLPIERIYRRDFTPVQIDHSMQWPVDAFVRGVDPAFFVKEGEEFVGVLSSESIIRAIQSHREHDPVRLFYTPGVVRLDVHQTAKEGLHLLVSFPNEIALVTKDGHSVGVVDAAALRRAMYLSGTMSSVHSCSTQTAPS